MKKSSPEPTHDEHGDGRNEQDVQRVLFHGLTPSRVHVLQWLKKELPYADSKFGKATDASVEDQDDFEERLDWIINYALRAKKFDLSTPQGRQALGKATTAFVRLTESAVRVYGPLPKGGQPSGEIK